MRYELTLIKNPIGTYSFVGSVPLRLAYISNSGDFVTAKQVESEMLLPAKYRKIKSRSFNNREAAIAAAKMLGHDFKDATENGG